MKSKKFFGNIEHLNNMWKHDRWRYERPKNIYQMHFDKSPNSGGLIKMSDSVARTELYSLVRTAIKGATAIDCRKLQIIEQTLLSNMGRMPTTDWKQRATSRPTWLREDIKVAFENSLKKNWRMLLMWQSWSLQGTTVTQQRRKRRGSKCSLLALLTLLLTCASSLFC